MFLAQTLCKLTPLWAFTLGIRGLQTAASIKAIYKLSPLQLWLCHLAPEHVAFYRLCFNCRVNIEVRGGAGESDDVSLGRGEDEMLSGGKKGGRRWRRFSNLSSWVIFESWGQEERECNKSFSQILKGCDLFSGHANGTLLCHTPVYRTLCIVKTNKQTPYVLWDNKRKWDYQEAGQQMVKCRFVPVTINEWPLLAKRRTTGPNALFMVSGPSL